MGIDPAPAPAAAVVWGAVVVGAVVAGVVPVVAGVVPAGFVPISGLVVVSDGVPDVPVGSVGALVVVGAALIVLSAGPLAGVVAVAVGAMAELVSVATFSDVRVCDAVG